MYEIETRKQEPKNFFAGDFPTLTETGVAGENLAEHIPVTKNAEGKIVAIAPASGTESSPVPSTVEQVIGITATTAEKDAPVVYYVTGEFFAEALVLPESVEMETLKDTLKKISIFLK